MPIQIQTGSIEEGEWSHLMQELEHVSYAFTGYKIAEKNTFHKQETNSSYFMCMSFDCMQVCVPYECSDQWGQKRASDFL